MAEVIDLSQATKVADVVPLWDSVQHEVPGGYVGYGALGYGCADYWLAIDTAEHPRLAECPCRPSVLARREGSWPEGHLGAVVVHHAFDGRTSGSSA